MSFLRARTLFAIRPILRPSLTPIYVGRHFATGYGDPSDDAHPATANSQDQGSSTKSKQAEHPGRRSNEPSSQGGSKLGSEKTSSKDTSPDSAPTSTSSSSAASETSWKKGDNDTSGGSRVHGSEKKESVLGGSLSGNKDKWVVDTEGGWGAGREEDVNEDKGEEREERDARDVAGRDDSRKQS